MPHREVQFKAWFDTHPPMLGLNVTKVGHGMRSPRIDEVDHLPRPVIGLSHDYADGFLIEPHEHRRGQLMNATSGLIVLTTPEGKWVMPPHRGMWIPAGVRHSVRAVGLVRMQSLYVETDRAEAMPVHCQVLEITSFMRSLIGEVVGLSLAREADGRSQALMDLTLYEMERLPSLPLSLPFPSDERLAKKCREFVGQPNIHQTTDDWSRELGMSRRAFTRIFRQQTGLSFVGWRQQACLLSALPQLSAGQSVTSVAMELGYENPAAFTIMFKRAFGKPPLAYLGLR
ncbi:AraC family transcriptional regulator [Rhizobium phaseoli]|uniref:AraC family transcriptional regulator n=1 Tax=Rhizobium phaseoli TaxID=396 RepID=UPI001FCDAF7C|nr:helix-turn-helix transcriptional regulator [Rhizobium phaseoli]